MIQNSPFIQFKYFVLKNTRTLKPIICLKKKSIPDYRTSIKSEKFVRMVHSYYKGKFWAQFEWNTIFPSASDAGMYMISGAGGDWMGAATKPFNEYYLLAYLAMFHENSG